MGRCRKLGCKICHTVFSSKHWGIFQRLPMTCACFPWPDSFCLLVRAQFIFSGYKWKERFYLWFNLALPHSQWYWNWLELFKEHAVTSDEYNALNPTNDLSFLKTRQIHQLTSYLLIIKRGPIFLESTLNRFVLNRSCRASGNSAEGSSSLQM